MSKKQLKVLSGKILGVGGGMEGRDEIVSIERYPCKDILALMKFFKKFIGPSEELSKNWFSFSEENNREFVLIVCSCVHLGKVFVKGKK